MQISKISSVHTVNVFNLKSKKQTKNNSVSNPQYGLIHTFNPTFGRDIVADKSLNGMFEKSLKENYFQLPPTARPDEFQKEAGKALLAGKDVIVEAPTGTGKTAIAHYATTNNINRGKTTFYTTPLKALSNQKLNEFRKVYGEDKVGILTGDRRENVEAPIIIMTTEVYRNMALSNKYGEKNPLMENLGTVIFDELHYLGDPDRGPVWEESLMYTPEGVQTLGLSATIGNPKELEKWIGNIDGGNVHLVSIPESARHVPLTFDMLDTSAYQTEQKRADNKLKRTGVAYETKIYDTLAKPIPSDFKWAVDTLKNKDRLPAIFFIFSRNYSREVLDYLGEEGQSLTTDNEKKQIEEIVEKHRAKNYIGSDLNEEALLNGYAIHNAGIIPGQKELIEELFQKKLVKVVLATETLAAGINMPAKTVVISSPYKPTDDVENTDKEEMSVRILTANEFKQMSGRAGRRGIDEIGYVYTMPTNMVAEQDFLNLEVMGSNPIKSEYNPDYGFLAGYYDRYSDSNELESIFAKSFFAYSDDESVRKNKQAKLLELADLKSQVLMERGFIDLDEDGSVHPTILAKMASKVRGYDAISLVETIADKTFDKISPEALAAVAGGIANPAMPMEKELCLNEDFSNIFQVDYHNIDNTFNRLYNYVQSALHKLGKSFEDFGSYDELLKFATSIERPDASEGEVASKLKQLKSVQAKTSIITKPVAKLSEEYSITEVVKALRKGDVVPTDVLNLLVKEIDKYKVKMNTSDISAYVAKLEQEYQSMDKSQVKGNKERSRFEKQKEHLEIKIQKAKDVLYLDENLYGVISQNNAFVKEHPIKQVQKELKEVEALHVQICEQDKLVRAIGGLMSLEEYENSNNLVADNMTNMGKVQDSFNVLINKALEVYATEINCNVQSKPPRYGKNAVQTLYNWALMNKMNSDSMTNWIELLGKTPEKTADEGTLYRRVMQTADLISQIGEIATVGYKESQTEEDKAYYAELKQTASQARNLLIREPATV